MTVGELIDELKKVGNNHVNIRVVIRIPEGNIIDDGYHILDIDSIDTQGDEDGVYIEVEG